MPDLAAPELADNGPVPQDDDAVGALLDLGETVRDEDDGDARGLELADHAQQVAQSRPL